MVNEADEAATNWREIDRWDRGVGWLAHPDEDLERASHAIEVDGEVWVIDPVDVPGLDDLLAEFGPVAGAVVLLDRHTRDAGAIAGRHGVSVHVPRWMSGIEETVDAPVVREPVELANTGYGFHPVINTSFWQEAALYGEDSSVLVVPEALGTTSFFRAGPERVGVHPVLRLFPPRKLGRLDPDRLFVGHGEGIQDDATAAVREALDGSRARTPALYAGIAKSFLPV